MIHRLTIAAIAGALAGPLIAAVPRDFAVDLRATVSDTAPHIALSWTQRIQTNISAQKIHRRLKGQTTWTKLADLTATQTGYTDSTAQPNVEYEYWMERTLTGIYPTTAMGYLNAGVKVPEVDARGILLLVVDGSLAAALAPEIDQLRLDLAADGWTVQTLSATRTATAAATKALIAAAYAAAPTEVRAVYLLGHVPVPYSGNQAPDGHGDHTGAWPADGYYGEMDGTWTDTSVNTTTASRTQNRNIPGDGKFDQITFPSLVELGVGRVDLQNLNRSPSSTASETSRLRRYLRKAHDFRHKRGAYATVPRATLIRDGFGHAFSSEPFAVTAWAGAFTSVAHSPIDEAPSDQWFSPAYAGGKTYLWGHGGGGGSHEYASSLGTSTDFGHRPSRVVFASVFGSYHGDWDVDNNLMRSVVAGNATQDSLALCCFWAGRPNWFVHRLGMGATLGEMTRTSMNASLAGGGGYLPGTTGSGGVHLGLMGDPALRIHAVEPPRGLAAASANGAVELKWLASTEAGVTGYHVYRGATAAGPFSRLTASPQTGTTFSDGGVTAGSSYVYLVRTQKLESVPGGSYYNLSVGSAVAVKASSAATSVPFTPSDLTVLAQTGGVSTKLGWRDNATDETGFRIERRVNGTGPWTTVGQVPADTVEFTDVGPFTNGNVYYYRVFAPAAAGESEPSNVASFDAVAGFVEFAATKGRVAKNAGPYTIQVNRFGGGVGAISVSYTTTASSAVAGTHFTATSGTLTWADGEQGPKVISVPIVNTAAPQLPRQLKISLSSPTGGAGLGVWNSTAVLIEDPTATLAAPWTSAMIGTITDSAPAVSAEGALGDATMGGSGLTANATADEGRFIYQSRAGDGILTAQIPSTTPEQGTARFAVMVRATTGTGSIFAATASAAASANYGTKLASRTASGGATVVTPATDNNLDVPRWLRITRAGNTFTSETSADGLAWTSLGSATVAGMPATALWGLFHYSSDWASSTTYLGDFQAASYRNVTLTELPAPAPPTGLALGAVGNESVVLTWTASANAGGYRIERTGDDGTLTTIDVPNGGAASHTDATVRGDTGYRYRIAAYNSTAPSAWTAAVTTVTPAADVVTILTTDDVSGADAGARAAQPDQAFGIDSSLQVSGTTPGTGDVAGLGKAWLRFNLGALPPVKAATLKLAFIQDVDLGAALDAGKSFQMQVRLLAEASDTWEEEDLTWNNAPQNSTGTSGLTGTAPTLQSYWIFDSASIPAAGAVESIDLNAGSLNSGRGANNLVTLALLSPSAEGGGLLWASREHATLAAPTLEVVTAGSGPTRPGFLAVSPAAGETGLSWFDAAADESGYAVERRAANGAWTPVVETAANATSFADTGVVPGVHYEYRIRSRRGAEFSSWATQATVAHTTAASVDGPAASGDGTTFSAPEFPSARGSVPTGFQYSATPASFVSGQTLSTTTRNDFSGWRGMKFTVGSAPVIVHELARWVAPGNTGTHAVKLVNATTGANLAGGSVNVATAGGSTGFRYARLPAPVTLAAGASYHLVSQETNGGDLWYDGAATTLVYPATVATVDSAVKADTTNYTVQYATSNSHGPLSFRFTMASEPFVTGHSLAVTRNDVTGWRGMHFTVGDSPLLVSQLGRWVVAGNSGVHAVRLVNATTGAVLASASIATAGAPSGAFRYAALASSVTLDPGTRCVLASQETAGGDLWLDHLQPAAGAASGYHQWLLAQGLPMDGAANGSPTATPAGDGLPNLVKYSLGLSPFLRGDQGRLAFGISTVDGSDYLTLQHVRPEPLPSGVSCTVEGCDALESGAWSPAGLVEVGNSVDAGLRTLLHRDALPLTSRPHRFLRVKVTMP